MATKFLKDLTTELLTKFEKKVIAAEAGDPESYETGDYPYCAALTCLECPIGISTTGTLGCKELMSVYDNVSSPKEAWEAFQHVLNIAHMHGLADKYLEER